MEITAQEARLILQMCQVDGKILDIFEMAGLSVEERRMRGLALAAKLKAALASPAGAGEAEKKA